MDDLQRINGDGDVDADYYRQILDLFMNFSSGSNKALTNYSSTIKKPKNKPAIRSQNQPESLTNRDDQKKREIIKHNALQQRTINCSPRHLNSFNSFRSSVEDSLLGKLKKQGYISHHPSNNISKQASPVASKIKQQSHKRIISQLQSSNYDSTRPTTPSHHLEPKENAGLGGVGASKGMFELKHVIGKGGFGRVWKVEFKRNKKVYAMKEMSKALIISKKSVPSVMNERQLLASLTHPFLVNMVQSFQDRETLYLIMDFMPGGDLRYHIAKKRRFTEEEAKFIIVCVFIGLRYLHEREVIHRDIKPQNIVLDERGYARVTDLGVARKYRENNASDTSGTPGYMAPEVLCRQNHSYSVDYFALGVIAYELMLRKRPYCGRNRKEIRDEILSRQVQVKKHEIPDSWSLQSADFINRLIQRKPSHRLGNNSADEIAQHPWLRSYPLAKVVNKSLQSPYLPNCEEGGWNDDNMSSENTEMKELIGQNEMILRKEEVQELFSGYEGGRLD